MEHGSNARGEYFDTTTPNWRRYLRLQMFVREPGEHAGFPRRAYVGLEDGRRKGMFNKPVVELTNSGVLMGVLRDVETTVGRIDFHRIGARAMGGVRERQAGHKRACEFECTRGGIEAENVDTSVRPAERADCTVSPVVHRARDEDGHRAERFCRHTGDESSRSRRRGLQHLTDDVAVSPWAVQAEELDGAVVAADQ